MATKTVYLLSSACFRSNSNWGRVYAKSLEGDYAVTYYNRACSGAVIRDLLQPRSMGYPRLGRCPATIQPDITVTEGPENCMYMLAPQISSVDRTVDLVLMTISGNDAKFSDIVMKCFVASLRNPDDCRGAVEFAQSQIPLIQSELVKALAALRTRMKDEAKVVLVAYPHLMLENIPYELAKYPVSSMPVPVPPIYVFDVRAAVRGLSERADQVQKEAVAQANAAAGREFVVFYDKTKSVFKGHEPNPRTYEQNEKRWIHEFNEPSLGISPVEFYHPNREGHRNWGVALAESGTFGAVGGRVENGANIDMAFLVDTTGSMGGVIAEVRQNIRGLVNELATVANSYRVAVVSYRDFPNRTGALSDYPSRIDTPLTRDTAAIQNAINSLSASGGGDIPETMLSGMKAAIDLDWYVGVTKSLIVIGDAPMLLERGAEPFSGLTPEMITKASLAVDPVQVIGVNVGSLVTPAFQQIANQTGGGIVSNVTNLTGTLLNIINTTSGQPQVWIGETYIGKIGVPVVFDSQGTYDPRGLSINLFEWDFDGNGTYDASASTPTISHTYTSAFEGYVVLRATNSNGGKGTASARILVNEAGSAPQASPTVPCEIGPDGYSIIDDGQGNFLACNATKLPTKDREGVSEGPNGVGPGVITADSALAKLRSAIGGVRPQVFHRLYVGIARSVKSSQFSEACSKLSRLIRTTKRRTRANGSSFFYIPPRKADSIIQEAESLSTVLEC